VDQVTEENPTEEGSIDMFKELLNRQIFRDRRFFSSPEGYIGLASSKALPTDIICILFGASLPYILRKTERDGYYVLVGEAYVHGLMYGRAIEMLNEGRFKQERILII